MGYTAFTLVCTISGKYWPYTAGSPPRIFTSVSMYSSVVSPSRSSMVLSSEVSSFSVAGRSSAMVSPTASAVSASAVFMALASPASTAMPSMVSAT